MTLADRAPARGGPVSRGFWLRTRRLGSAPGRRSGLEELLGFGDGHLGLSRGARRLHFLQRLGRIAELGQAHVELVQHRQIQAAHLAVGLFFVVEHAAAFDAAAGAAQHHDRKLRRVVAARAD